MGLTVGVGGGLDKERQWVNIGTTIIEQKLKKNMKRQRTVHEQQ